MSTNTMSHESQDKPVGNTISTGTTQYYRWFFTLKYDSIQVSQLWDTLNEFAKQFVFSVEKASTGYLHYQGCFSLKTKERFLTVKNLFPSVIHLEVNKDWHAARNYCKKEDSHVEGPYTETRRPLRTITVMRQWQENLFKLMKFYKTIGEDRKIIWICDEEGNAGKSLFCKYMALNHDASVVGNGGFADIAYAVKNNPDYVLMNLSRSNEGRVNYGVIEAIKDGMLFSAKYESTMKIFDSPVVVVMANFFPEVHAMSMDRWEIYSIGKGGWVQVDAAILKQD